jgi:hypothetical protein
MIIVFWEMTPCGSYKMIIIIVTAVETSNLTFCFMLVRRFLDIRKDGQWLVMVSEDPGGKIFLLND